MKAGMLISTLAAMAALLGSAAPAYAEFESQVKGADKGTGELFETTLEAGGATMTCTAEEPGNSKTTWTVKGTEKEQVKGPNLGIVITKLGTCTVKASGLKEEVATVSECEAEIKQTKVQGKEQGKIPGKIVKLCTIKAASCEIKLEPKTNSALNVFEVSDSGDANENTLIIQAVTNIVTEVVGAKCESLGIKASKEGRLLGVGEFYSLVQNAGPRFYSAPDMNFRLTGTQASVQTFTAEAGKSVTCAEVKSQTLGTGFPESPTGSVSLVQKFEKCTALGTEVTNNFMCNMAYLSGGAVSILTTCKIEVRGNAKCNFEVVTANRDRRPVSYANLAPGGEKKQVQAISMASGLTITSNGGLCGNSTNDGDFAGKSIWKATNVIPTQIDFEIK